MNPIFIVIVIILALMLWAGLNIFFPTIGDVLLDMWEDIKRSINKE